MDAPNIIGGIFGTARDGGLSNSGRGLLGRRKSVIRSFSNFSEVPYAIFLQGIYDHDIGIYPLNPTGKPEFPCHVLFSFPPDSAFLYPKP